LTVEELVKNGDHIVGIAHGLGEQVTVLGFSLGGLVAAWLAHRCPDLAHVIIVAAPFGLQAVPTNLAALYANILPWLPPFFRWWDPEKKAARDAPSHAHAGYWSHTVAAILRFGLLTRANAAQHQPVAPAITVITNPRDAVVRNELAQEVVAKWQQHGYANIQTVELPERWGVTHDFMDLSWPNQKPKQVYPLLIAHLTNPYG
jgi:pimeloyl-ACP methyl ester carboxylesterase